jgi:hypothetical protein
MRCTIILLLLLVFLNEAFSQAYNYLPEDNAIQGWNRSQLYLINDPDTLHYIINGESPAYIDCGLSDFALGVYRNENDTEQNFCVYISHFNDTSGAKCLYSKRSGHWSSECLPIADLGDSAFARNNYIAVLNRSYVIEIRSSVMDTIDSLLSIGSYISSLIDKTITTKTLSDSRANKSEYSKKSGLKASGYFDKRSNCYLLNSRVCTDNKIKAAQNTIIINAADKTTRTHNRTLK